MDDIRFKNLFDAFTAQIDYTNFIESYGEDLVFFHNTNFDLLQTIFAGFCLTALKDTYFTKRPDNSLKPEVLPEMVKKLAEMIAVNNGKGYSIGDLHYCDEYALIEKIRNKIAHGSFIIRNGNIIIKEKNVEGKIKVQDFVKFVSSFEVSADLNLLNRPYIKVYNKCIDENKLRKIKTAKDFDAVCRDMYKIEFKDTPIFPRNRNEDYCVRKDQFYEHIEKKINAGKIDEIEETLKAKDYLLREKGINMECKITRFIDLDYYDVLKEKYMKQNEYYKKLLLADQINCIGNSTYVLGKGQYRRFDIIKGIMLNITIIKVLQENPGYTFKDIILATPDLHNLYIYHIQDAILSSYLAAFNSIYEYGLEEGLTTQGNYNLISIYEGKSLDFSQLEIEELDDPNMEIEHTFTKYLTDVQEYETKNIDRADKLILICENKLKQYLKNCKNKDEEKIRQFTIELEEAERTKLELLEKIKPLKEFSKQFDLDKYTRNINIIIHIRNAIAHGNIFIDSYNDNVLNTEIILRDYLNGQIVYEKKIKISDFVILFHDKNIEKIFNYIVDNINDKELIDEKYYDKLNFRQYLRQLYNSIEFKDKTI